MNIISTTKRMWRGEVNARSAALEIMRRISAALARRRERAQLPLFDQQPARLRDEFARIRASDLLAHFRSRLQPKFFPGFSAAQETARLQQQLFPAETSQLLDQATRIAGKHCWTVLGLGEKCFGGEDVNWNRDPLSGFEWPLRFSERIMSQPAVRRAAS